MDYLIYFAIGLAALVLFKWALSDVAPDRVDAPTDEAGDL